MSKNSKMNIFDNKLITIGKFFENIIYLLFDMHAKMFYNFFDLKNVNLISEIVYYLSKFTHILGW